MKLVSDWKDSWKWLSVHVSVIISVVNAAQATVPYVQTWLSPTQLAVTNAALGAVVIWVRLIDQH